MSSVNRLILVNNFLKTIRPGNGTGSGSIYSSRGHIGMLFEAMLNNNVVTNCYNIQLPILRGWGRMASSSVDFKSHPVWRPQFGSKPYDALPPK